MTSISKFVATIATATLLVGSPALAAIKQAKITATAASGIDLYDSFGTGSTSLAGQDFTVIFNYDTSLGSLFSVPGAAILDGGVGFSNPVSPMLLTSLTINGVTKSFIPYGGAALSISPGTVNYLAQVQTNTPTLQTSYGASFATNSLTGAGSLTSDIGPTSFTGTIVFVGSRSPGSPESYTVSASSGTISVTNAVPEPASWAMLIAGFGLTGAALRRTRRQVRLAA